MELSLQHFAPCSPRTWWELLEDPAFLAHTDDAAGIRRETLANEPGAGRDGRRLLHVRWTSARELPKVVRKLVRADRISYELIQHLDDQNLMLDWEILPPISRHRFEGSGTFRIVPADGGSRRHVTGNIHVQVPIVGRQIERRLAAAIAQGHSKGAETVRRWLEDHP